MTARDNDDFFNSVSLHDALYSRSFVSTRTAEIRAAETVEPAQGPKFPLNGDSHTLRAAILAVVKSTGEEAPPQIYELGTDPDVIFRWVANAVITACRESEREGRVLERGEVGNSLSVREAETAFHLMRQLGDLLSRPNGR